MSVKELVGRRIKEVRQAKGLSQEALSEKIGMSAKYLSSIEWGKENPTLDTLIKLADALHRNIKYFQ
ncbi:MAG: HTH-type transcriptional regulator ImmR [Syntrophorhabdaceae bacterium PtaU1.Bin034]|jgi:transcriptional regulator with XRE-family HTH domain|nr:MAG: HTH-type transcriptional regulator ImmR [Syntrophorhabdaceae bacterium PtaU1.Bin034]